MLFNNNHNNIINIIDRKLSKSIMLFKWKANIIKNKTKRKLTKIKVKYYYLFIISPALIREIMDIELTKLKVNSPK